MSEENKSNPSEGHTPAIKGCFGILVIALVSALGATAVAFAAQWLLGF